MDVASIVFAFAVVGVVGCLLPVRGCDGRWRAQSDTQRMAFLSLVFFAAVLCVVILGLAGGK